ncbi:unnamed protein product [Rhizophagus irregularis]|nr:unnamed protein product [Rhizophagus irregularis]
MALPVGFQLPELCSFEQDHEDYVDNFIAYINLAGATIAHIRGANAGAITGAVASFPNVPLGLTGAQIILAQNVAEDWTITGGRPTNTAPVAPNAGGGVPIILAGIRSGQRLHRIKKHFPSTNRYIKMLEIGTLKQEAHESSSSFWAKIQKYGDHLGYTDKQKKTHFISGVRVDIRDEIFRIGQHRPIDEILDSLADIELRQGLLGPSPSYHSYIPTPPAISNNAPQQQGISLADIQKTFQDALAQQKTENQALVKKVTELQSQMAQQAQIPAPQTVEPVRQPKGPPSSLKTEEGLKNYYVAEYLKESRGGDK